VGQTLSLVATDYAGVDRPQGSAYDIGAYEYLAPGSALTLPTNLRLIDAP
jgi:hypothetical protein